MLKQKLTSRKWIAAVIGVIYTMTAMGGYELEVTEVAVVDGLIALIIFMEGMVDIARARFLGK